MRKKRLFHEEMIITDLKSTYFKLSFDINLQEKVNWKLTNEALLSENLKDAGKASSAPIASLSWRTEFLEF